MSITYNFEISVSKKEGISSIHIIESLLEAKTITKEEYLNIASQKEKNNEMIALALFLLEEDYRYRIDIIITPEFNILISPDDKTKKILISNLKILDVNWYLLKFLPALSNKNMIIESFSFIQC